MIYKITKREYRKLLIEYKKLKNKYSKLKRRKINMPFAIACYIFAIVGMLYYRNTIIIETGILLMFVGLSIELNGTKKGWWKYADSLYMFKGRVPIELILQYFALGAIVASYYLFRTYSVTGFVFF